MRAVAQRVSSALVRVDHEVTGEIGNGLLVYVGAMKGDTAEDVRYLADKIANLRIFEDNQGKMSRSLIDVQGSALLVSQFTLFGDLRRGRRPSFDDAAPPEIALTLYEDLCNAVQALGVRVQTGRFKADMRVLSEGRGPITILIDSRKSF
jgi:D-tyrosyl-tRNA(Tyr) deacylase